MHFLVERSPTGAIVTIYPGATIEGWDDGFLIVRDGPLCLRLSGRFLEQVVPHLRVEREARD